MSACRTDGAVSQKCVLARKAEQYKFVFKLYLPENNTVFVTRSNE